MASHSETGTFLTTQCIKKNFTASKKSLDVILNIILTLRAPFPAFTISNKVPWLSSASALPFDFLDFFWEDFWAEGCLDFALFAACKNKIIYRYTFGYSQEWLKQTNKTTNDPSNWKNISINYTGVALEVSAARFLPRTEVGTWTGVSKSLSSLDLFTDDCSLKRHNIWIKKLISFFFWIISVGWNFNSLILIGNCMFVINLAFCTVDHSLQFLSPLISAKREEETSKKEVNNLFTGLGWSVLRKNCALGLE